MSDQPATRYSLEVDLRITKEYRSTPPGEHEYWNRTSDNLTVSERIELGALDFIGVMGVLGRLHESVSAIRPQGLPIDPHKP